MSYNKASVLQPCRLQETYAENCLYFSNWLSIKNKDHVKEKSSQKDNINFLS